MSTLGIIISRATVVSNLTTACIIWTSLSSKGSFDASTGKSISVDINSGLELLSLKYLLLFNLCLRIMIGLIRYAILDKIYKDFLWSWSSFEVILKLIINFIVLIIMNIIIVYIGIKYNRLFEFIE